MVVWVNLVELLSYFFLWCFFFNDTATTEIYTLSLHDALPVSRPGPFSPPSRAMRFPFASTMVRRGPRFGAFRFTGMPGPSSPMMKFGCLPPQQCSAQGRCRLFHCASYLPLPSNTCTRWFSRSATYTQPSWSVTMLCTMLNWPGSAPGSPQVFSNLPSGVYLWTQALP